LILQRRAVVPVAGDVAVVAAALLWIRMLILRPLAVGHLRQFREILRPRVAEHLRALILLPPPVEAQRGVDVVVAAVVAVRSSMARP
jgi:hypothetical protein